MRKEIINRVKELSFQFLEQEFDHLTRHGRVTRWVRQTGRPPLEQKTAMLTELTNFIDNLSSGILLNDLRAEITSFRDLVRASVAVDLYDIEEYVNDAFLRDGLSILGDKSLEMYTPEEMAILTNWIEGLTKRLSGMVTSLNAHIPIVLIDFSYRRWKHPQHGVRLALHDLYDWLAFESNWAFVVSFWETVITNALYKGAWKYYGDR